ncbi:alanyl-tRNA editing protein [Lacrimispora amygdalina]|uniref:Alanyl-tRNA editing protein n=1 Tax=Lacrimispora amygdalina TaxID=253257 RepID=A0A3E2NAW0_9FIRM|nr:alanyl-tRNA editing protein [Clostridium indicum]RFZ78155.1 alanyl-tRNA editing protein [Clostridium indicum]
MEKLYYERPYVKKFEAEVVECRPDKDGNYLVRLNRTAFYPEGGGQPADTGTLGEALVCDVRERPEGIVHITDRPIPEKTLVTGILDWERRFSHMQNHSGEHLLSGVVHKHYGYDNIGFHMGKDEVTVDFNGTLTMEQLEEVEAEVNELIWQNIPVLETYPSKEELDALDYRSKKELSGQVRIIEFPGADVCACCGTHVMTAGEIGILKVTGLARYKGGVRVSLLCGREALLDYRKKLKAVQNISVLLSAKPDSVSDAVSKLKEEGIRKDSDRNRLTRELLVRKAAEYPESDAPVLVLEENLLPAQLRQFCTMLYEEKKGSIVLVCSGEEGLYQYAAGSSTADMRALSRQLNERLNGRGGGNTLLAQGTFQTSFQEIQKVFKEEL